MLRTKHHRRRRHKIRAACNELVAVLAKQQPYTKEGELNLEFLCRCGHSLAEHHDGYDIGHGPCSKCDWCDEVEKCAAPS